MSYFKGSYLRVLTPLTSDGNTLRYDGDGQVLYDEMHLPITAKTIMEKKNLKLPLHLRKVIEEVGGAEEAPLRPTQPRPSPQPVQQKRK